MKKYIVQKHQSLIDIAVQLYGNVDALGEILELNPTVFGSGAECVIGTEIAEGTELQYSETSKSYNRLAVEIRNGEVLATVTENTVLLELPVPEYEFHPRTLDFFDGIADTPGGPWEDYFSTEEAIMLDRLVRDLNGETNGDYTTVNIWNKFIAMYPVMASQAPIQAKNLFQPHLDMTFAASGVSHSHNAISMDGVTGSADTHFTDGVDTNQANMCMGVVFSNYVHVGVLAGFPNGFMGAFSAGKLLFIRTFNGIYDGMITVFSGGFGSTVPYQANDFLHIQSNTSEQALFQGGSNTKISHKGYVTGTSTGAHITIGTEGTTRVQADFHIAYIGQALDNDERKSLMNSINYFMYRKGVRGSFAAIV